MVVIGFDDQGAMGAVDSVKSGLRLEHLKTKLSLGVLPIYCATIWSREAAHAVGDREAYYDHVHPQAEDQVMEVVGALRVEG